MTWELLEENIPLELAYNFKGLVHCHHGGTWQQAGRHGAGFLHLAGNRQWSEGHTEGSLSKRLKAGLHSGTLPATRPHLLQQGHTS